VAIKPVEMIAPAPVVKEKKARKGGGGLGQAIGMAAGAALGGVAGTYLAPGAGTAAGAKTGALIGAAGVGAIGGAVSGASLGGMIGEKVKPTREGSSNAMERRVMGTPQLMQSERTQKLRESVMALHSQPPEIQQQHAPTLVQAYLKSLQDDNMPTGVA
jgi:hypothetical protein